MLKGYGNGLQVQRQGPFFGMGKRMVPRQTTPNGIPGNPIMQEMKIMPTLQTTVSVSGVPGMIYPIQQAPQGPIKPKDIL